MIHWFLQDLLFFAPLVGIVLVFDFLRWADRKFDREQKDVVNVTIHGKTNTEDVRKAIAAGLGGRKKTHVTIKDLPPPPQNLIQPMERTATDWGARLGVLLNDLTADGFVVLLDTDRDEIIIAPRRYKGGNQLAKVHAKSDGTGWELK